jgi:hypothetical protein
MTVVNPKSISGINSITTGSGSDNLLTIHTSDASSTERVRINSSGDVIVGSGITVSPDGDIFATGVTTSTTFVGALTGNVTGNVSGSSGSTTGNAAGLTGTPNISVGTIAGSTGTFTGDVDIADKIVHTGDTNTAIRFPSADTITTETGGSERLRITSDGELIIGMTSGGGAAEDARLQVRGDTYAKAKIQVLGTHNDDNPVGLTLAKSRSSGNTILGDNDDIGQIDFAANDGNGFHNVGRIMVSHDGSGNGNDDLPSMMRFFTTANGGVTLAERLRISSNGDLLYAQSAYNYACWYKSPTNSSSNAATSNSEVLVYGTAVIANTDVYNTSNGRYTAPVDGLYYIRANGLIDNNAAQAGMQLKLYKNGSEYGTQIAYNTYLSEDSPNRYKLLSGTGIMYMDTGDYAQIWATSGMHTSNETNLIVYLIRGTI